MTIQPIGAHSAALYITPADLRKHGATPEGLTRELALELTLQAFLQAGIPVEGPVEIEAYPESCGVLVFARFQPMPRIWFPFESLEDVLSAARDLGPLCPDGDLVWCRGAYYLSIPSSAEQAACRLREFSRPLERLPFLDAQLSEHGRTILAGRALHVLLHYFPEKLE